MALIFIPVKPVPIGTALAPESASQLSTQAATKYGKDPRVRMLKTRFYTMRQRCYRDSYKQPKYYRQKGIKVLFASANAFVQWALDKWPTSSFKGLEFDRIDNSGP